MNSLQHTEKQPYAPIEVEARTSRCAIDPDIIEKELTCARHMQKMYEVNIISIAGWNEGGAFDPRLRYNKWDVENVTKEAQRASRRFIKQSQTPIGRLVLVERLLTDPEHHMHKYGPYLREVPLDDQVTSRHIADHADSVEIQELEEYMRLRGALDEQEIDLHLSPIAIDEAGEIIPNEPVCGVFTHKRAELSIGQRTVDFYDQLSFIAHPQSLVDLHERLSTETDGVLNHQTSVERSDFKGLLEYSQVHELMQEKPDSIMPVASRQFLKLRSKKS